MGFTATLQLDGKTATGIRVPIPVTADVRDHAGVDAGDERRIARSSPS